MAFPSRSALFACLLALLLALPLLPAGVAGNHSHGVGNGVTVTPRSPTIDDIDLSAADDEPGEPGVIAHPTAGADRAVPIAVSASDRNGHNDLESLTFTIYEPDGVTVHRAETAASKASGTGQTAVFEAASAMAYHDPPGDYHVKVVATDRGGLQDTAWSQFSYAELAGVGIDQAAISLNPGGEEGTAVAPGGDTRENPSPVVFQNAGNVAIDAELSGTDLANDDDSATIPVGAIVYASAADFAGETALTGTATRFALDLAPGAASETTVYFAIAVPDGTSADTYRGTATIAAVKAT